MTKVKFVDADGAELPAPEILHPDRAFGSDAEEEAREIVRELATCLARPVTVTFERKVAALVRARAFLGEGE